MQRTIRRCQLFKFRPTYLEPELNRHTLTPFSVSAYANISARYIYSISQGVTTLLFAFLTVTPQAGQTNPLHTHPFQDPLLPKNLEHFRYCRILTTRKTVCGLLMYFIMARMATSLGSLVRGKAALTTYHNSAGSL